ncbi:MAG: M48 family metallopeptidase [Bacteroidales bacterium]
MQGIFRSVNIDHNKHFISTVKKPEKNIVSLDNVAVELIRKPIKNIYIRVYPPDGRVVVSVPRLMSRKDLSLFLLSKSSWIRKQHNKLRAAGQQKSYEYLNGEYHFYEGTKYALEVYDYRGSARVYLDGTSIIMLVKNDYDREKRRAVLEGWYRQRLKEKLPSLISRWEKIMHVDVSEFRVRRMKSRWGTCNIREKRIWINLELAKYPDTILEYIVVHEMVHLLERRHDARFYALMGKYLPDWKERRSLIKTITESHFQPSMR